MPWLTVLLGYLLGSIPTAYVSGRLLRGRDIRQMGDGNMGAANTFRLLGAKAGLVVGAIDAGKGVLAIVIAQTIGVPLLIVLITGVATVIGHSWPIFLGFKGGRGEATTIGVLLTLVTQPMLIVTGPALVALIISRKVILSSALLFIPLPLVCWGLGFPGTLLIYSMALPGLVGFTHFLRTRRVGEALGINNI